MLYDIYFTFLPRQFLGYELEEKQYNIFPPGPVFFLLVTEKLVKKLMGERKQYFFPFPYFSAIDHAVFGSPSQTVTVLRCMKIMIFTLSLNVHSSACKFNDFVMNNPDNCSFNHFFFFQYTFTKCPSLSCHSRLHSSQYSIDNTPLFLGKTNNLIPVNEKILFRSIQYLFSPKSIIYAICRRQCCAKITLFFWGKNIGFRGGGRE